MKEKWAPQKPDLKVWSNGSYWIIAPTEEEVCQVMSDFEGYTTLREYMEDYPDDGWETIPDHKTITMNMTEDCGVVPHFKDTLPLEGRYKILFEATAKQWVEHMGKTAFLMTTER